MAQAKYRRIAQDLLEQIQSGALQPGDQLPTELSLGDKYRASRNTIRDAVKWLALRGLVEARPGQGTFAAQRIQPYVTTLTPDPRTALSSVEGKGWLTEARERGRNAIATVPRVRIQGAPRHIADQLHIAQGTQIITRHQERYLDSTPFALQTTAYPLELVEHGATGLLVAEDVPEGTIKYLSQRLGLKQAGHRDRFLVRPPEEDETRFFKLPDDGRVYVIEFTRTGYRAGDDGPVPFRVTFTVFPADRHQFVIDSGDVPQDQPAAAGG